MAQQGNSVFQFKISLKYPKPPIWRRVLVPGDYTFKDLHFVIQSVLNWNNTHLHRFDLKHPATGENIEVGGVGDLGFGGWWPESTKLNTYFRKENDKASYEYDFGCSWYHIIILEKFLPADPAKKYPQCIAGRRASPLEDTDPDDYDKPGESVSEVFDPKLVTFRMCPDFKVEEVQSEDLSSDEISTSEFSNYEGTTATRGIAKVEDSEQVKDSEQSASGPKLATSSTKLGEQAIDKRQKVIDYLSTQNSNAIPSSVLPQKRKVPEDEPKSVPAKRIVQESKGLQQNSNSVFKKSSVIENSDSEPSNSNINVPSATEDAEDHYGKFIASQMRDIKDLEKREDLRIEIQQLISKYRFKN